MVFGSPKVEYLAYFQLNESCHVFQGDLTNSGNRLDNCRLAKMSHCSKGGLDTAQTAATYIQHHLCQSTTNIGYNFEKCFILDGFQG